MDIDLISKEKPTAVLESMSILHIHSENQSPSGGIIRVTGEPSLFSRWERDTRYYELHLRQDLWGDWMLTRVWGRRGTALGQIRHEHYSDYYEAASQYTRYLKQRGRRGYIAVLSSH